MIKQDLNPTGFFCEDVSELGYCYALGNMEMFERWEWSKGLCYEETSVSNVHIREGQKETALK